MTSGKRFIAGAKCPSCGEQDKLYTAINAEGVKYRACVRCDFNEPMRFETPLAELDTRVNLSREQRAAETQLVRLIDPQK